MECQETPAIASDRVLVRCPHCRSQFYVRSHGAANRQPISARSEAPAGPRPVAGRRPVDDESVLRIALAVYLADRFCHSSEKGIPRQDVNAAAGAAAAALGLDGNRVAELVEICCRAFEAAMGDPL